MKSSLFLLLVLCIFTANASQDTIIRNETLFHPVTGKLGMVSTQEAVATEIGLDILKKGGNAVDAAVAVGFAMAVTLPKAGNIGGGGFMLIHLADQTIAIDYREMAPAAAHKDMFLDTDGTVNNELARNSFRSAGVPGTVAGLLHALNQYGTMKREEVLAPAIKLADEGFTLSYELALELEGRRKQLSRSAAGKRKFFKADGKSYKAGEIFKQKDLAWSLKQISKHGKQAFYEGKIAKRIVSSTEAHDGLITLRDLKNYEVKEREALVGTYRGYEIVSMPPPSSGGTHLIQMLNVLEKYELGAMHHNSANYLHILTETMKYAYADRSKYLGDPDFTDIPLEKLLSKSYADRIRTHINMNHARPSTEIGPGQNLPAESPDTTHYSIADSKGNVVSNTYTLNFSYGSGFVIAGTGILLNNEMDDFSAKVGSQNAYGLLGGKANSIGPQKRPLSAMTPTIVLKDGKPYLIVGSPGGSKIINAVLQVILNVIDHKMNIADASSVPRIHHQWLPDELSIEPGISHDTANLLLNKGHKVITSKALGATQSILMKDGLLYGASDPRRPGAKTMAY